MSRTPRSLLALIPMAGVAVLSDPAHADPAGPHAGQTPGPDVGPMLEIATGIGWIDRTEMPALAGGSIALAVGIRMSRRLALVVDVELTRQNDGYDQSSRYLGVQAMALQVWPSSRWWIRSGAGVGMAENTGGLDAYTRDGVGLAALLATGAEVYRRGDVSFDLQLRAAAVEYFAEPLVLSESLLVGVSWR